VTAEAAAQPQRLSRKAWSRRPEIAALAVVAWIPTVLLTDRIVGLPGQRLLGLLTWLLLVALLRGESPRTRAQVAVVVVFATVVEYCFAGWLGVYTYRLHNVPAFVPPGHGLVYLAALSIGSTALARRQVRSLVFVTAGFGGAWALWGVTVSSRPDVLGLFWFGCLVAFLVWGRQPGVYAGAFLVVSMLELIGTSLGTWRWAAVDPILGWVSMGNPPSGAAGGYGWFDLTAVLLAPAALRVLRIHPGSERA